MLGRILTHCYGRIHIYDFFHWKRELFFFVFFDLIYQGYLYNNNYLFYFIFIFINIFIYILLILLYNRLYLTYVCGVNLLFSKLYLANRGTKNFWTLSSQLTNHMRSLFVTEMSHEWWNFLRLKTNINAL